MRLLAPSNSASLLLSTLTFTTTAFASTTAPVPPNNPATPTTLPLLERDSPAAQVLVPYWSPLTTITLTTTQYLASPTTNTNPHYSEKQPETDPDPAVHNALLLPRQAAPVTAPAAALPSNPAQLSPITTMQVEQLVNGVAQQVQVVYTQLFSAVPDQGEAPGVGSIGLGTITGVVGVVRTARGKREAQPEPTAVGADLVVRAEKRAVVAVQEGGVVEEREKRDLHLDLHLDGARAVERRSLAGKVDANGRAGSALALLIAVAVMVVV